MHRILLSLFCIILLAVPAAMSTGQSRITPANVQALSESVVLQGHTDWIHDIAWSPNGAELVSASSDGTLRIWNQATGETLNLLAGHTAKVISVAWSADGGRISSGSLDDTARFWDAASGAPLGTLTGHTGDVWGVGWNASGTVFATASEDMTLRLWDGYSGAAQKAVEAHDGRIYDLEWNPGGTQIATGGFDGLVNIWNADGSSVTSLRNPFGSINALAWSEDGTQLAVVGETNEIALWNVVDSTLLMTLQAEQSALYSVDFKGSLLAVGGIAGQVEFFDLNTESVVHILNTHTNLVTGLAFSPDGSTLATGSYDTTVKLWR